MADGRVREELLAAVPATFASLLGRASCEEAVVKLYEFLECPVLVRSLLYSAMDMLWRELFPDDPELSQLYGLDLEWKGGL